MSKKELLDLRGKAIDLHERLMSEYYHEASRGYRKDIRNNIISYYYAFKKINDLLPEESKIKLTIKLSLNS